MDEAADRSPGGSWKTVTIDVDAPVPDIATGAATHLHITACTGGRPVGTLVLPAPFDPCPGWYLADAIGQVFARDVFATRLRAAWDSFARPPPSALDATVLVCSADRPDALRRCLASLARLSGAVHEIVVVDNGTRGFAETEAAVREGGARYVREPLPGLDRARNRGLAEVVTELALFTDDDVEVDSGWAAALVGCFADPLVMAASGLVLPAGMASAAQRRAEKVTSHGRGVHWRVADGSRVSPMVAGSMGAGASMAFRIPFLRAIGGFPEELDAGMPTRSGGDHYTFHRVLRAGYRMVYEPSAIAYHWHRDSHAALRAAVRGYGTGMSSFLLHSALRDQDPGAITEGAPALARYFARKLVRSMRRRSERTNLGLAVDEIAGTVQGPAAYRAAQRQVRNRSALHLPRAPLPAPWLDRLREAAPPPRPAHLPTLSVIVPSRGRRDQLVRLLRALDGQEYADDRLEVIACIDGDIDGSADAVRAAGLCRSPRIVVLHPPGRSRDHGSGAGVARNRGVAAATGDVLLFLDDDVTPLHSSVLLAHAAVHAGAGAPTAAVGALAVDLRAAEGYLAQRVRNWWIEQSTRLAASDELSFTDVSSGNLSVPRSLFEAVGGFGDLPRREDWELGWRLSRAGASIRWLEAGGVLHDIDVRVDNAFEDRRREGHGDVLLARRHPAALHLLRLAGWFDLAPRSRRLVRAVLDRPSYAQRLRAGQRALLGLERAGRKADYSKLLDRLSTLSYWLGVADAVEGQREWLDLVGAAIEALAEPYPQLDLERPRSLGALAAAGAPEVDVVFRGVTLGRAPLRWGGAPFLPSVFLARLVDEFAPRAITVAGVQSVGGQHPGAWHAEAGGTRSISGLPNGTDLWDHAAVTAVPPTRTADRRR
jgi:GT2 family glycosyltransferase